MDGCGHSQGSPGGSHQAPSVLQGTGDVWEQGSSVPGVRSMAWSHAFCSGSSSKASLEKTSLKSQYWTGTISLRGWLSSAFWTSWANCCDGVSIAPMYCSSHSGGMNMV